MDGSGAAPYRGSIAIRDGRISAIDRSERGPDAQAVEEIDATGRIVCPGFIDVHTHYDAQLFWDPALTPSCFHGVTTAIGGNCGFSIAPLAAEAGEREYLMRMLARVEGMPIESLLTGAPWDWRTTEEYLDRVDGHTGINVAFSVGHSAIRRAVMGPRAVGSKADAHDLSAMERLLRSGLEAGAIGFTSSWGLTHFDDDGQPVPSRHAEREELIALCRVVREYAGTSLEFIPTNGPFPAWVGELVSDMSVAAQRPLNWNILHIFADTLDEGLAKLAGGDLARQRGGKVVALTMPVSSSARFSLITGAALESLPGWKEVFALPIPERIAVFSDPEARARLNASAETVNFLPTNWAEHVIWDTFAPENKGFEGRTLADIGDELGATPWDALCQIAVADELKTSFGTVPRVATEADWAARVSVWRDGRAVIGASDAGAHLDMLATFAFPTAMLAAVREHRLLPIEEAVHMLTDIPARLYGIKERGRLLPGWHADLVVLDPDSVAPHPATMRYDLPGDQGRLYAESRGVDHVIVNGTPVVRLGALTGRAGGRLLRSGKDTATPSLD